MMSLQKHKDDLIALKHEYEERIHKITDHMAHRKSGMIEHWDDQAVVATQDDMRKNLLIEAEQNLALVNQALLRIDNDAYGVCTECGEEIEEPRLDAVPYATLCMQHAK